MTGNRGEGGGAVARGAGRLHCSLLALKI